MQRTGSLRQSESERREELELSEVQWMCLNRDDEQVAVRHARGTEAASEERTDKWK